MSGALYETPRLIARRWRTADRDDLAALNGDPEVMRYFPKTLDRGESDRWFDRIAAAWKRDGFCFPAVESKADSALIGFVGLARFAGAAPFAPAVEIGWRLARRFWGQGYASEAAAAALAYGFERLGLEEIVSFTAVRNRPSEAVMRRIGMTRDPVGDFDHPALPPGSPLRPHVLYRINRSAWRARSRS